MAAEATRRRFARRALLVAALVGIAASGLVVAFQDEVSTTEGRDSATGRNLRATFEVEVQDKALAGVTATLTLTNPSNRSVWFRGSECDGPGVPTIGPEGLVTPQGPELEGPIRDRLIAAAFATLRVELQRADAGFCEPAEEVVRVEPDQTLRWTYGSGELPVDRSSALTAYAVVSEVNRRGGAAQRLRLVVPFPELPNAEGVTPDQVVDRFLAAPPVADFLATTGEDSVLTVVSREGDLWRISLGSSGGDLAAEVHPDLSVTDVHVVRAPPSS